MTAGVSAGLPWDPPLLFRRGARDRLLGIRVFHDFKWLDVFPDRRAQFKHGKDLARTVIRECPDTHKPALLLTQRTDVEEGFRLTDTYLLFVVNIDDYRRSETNPALSYLASHLPVDVARLHGYADLADLGDPDELRDVINRHLKVQDVATWLREDPDRRRRLVEILNDVDDQHSADHSHGMLAAQDALDSLSALGELSNEQVVQLVDFTTKFTQGEHRLDLLRGATHDETGRRAAARVIHERTVDRIADAEAALAEYERLLSASDTTETDMQTYLTQNPLIFGLQYADIRPQVGGPSGTMDFLLERLDGYNDLVELKGPREKLILAPEHAPGTKLPSPHSYRLSKALGQALAQALAYRERLTRFPDVSEVVHGIPHARYPRLIIVLGRSENLDPHKHDVLRELNRSLHRAQVIGYDALASQARQTLSNVLKLLSSVPASSDPSDA